MGLYQVNCPTCDVSFQWFSGDNPAQLCPDCRPLIVTPGPPMTDHPNQPQGKVREFRLDEVIVKPKNNNCPDCTTRVATYIKNVKEWQSAYDAVCKERDEYKRLAESWMADYDRMVEKYEPKAASYE